VNKEIDAFDGVKSKRAKNFQAYLTKHYQRIPDYQ